MSTKPPIKYCRIYGTDQTPGRPDELRDTIADLIREFGPSEVLEMVKDCGATISPARSEETRAMVQTLCLALYSRVHRSAAIDALRLAVGDETASLREVAGRYGQSHECIRKRLRLIQRMLGLPSLSFQTGAGQEAFSDNGGHRHRKPPTPEELAEALNLRVPDATPPAA